MQRGNVFKDTLPFKLLQEEGLIFHVNISVVVSLQSELNTITEFQAFSFGLSFLLLFLSCYQQKDRTNGICFPVLDIQNKEIFLHYKIKSMNTSMRHLKMSDVFLSPDHLSLSFMQRGIIFFYFLIPRPYSNLVLRFRDTVGCSIMLSLLSASSFTNTLSRPINLIIHLKLNGGNTPLTSFHVFFPCIPDAISALTPNGQNVFLLEHFYQTNTSPNRTAKSFQAPDVSLLFDR